MLKRFLHTKIVGKVLSREQVYNSLSSNCKRLADNYPSLLRIPVQWGEQDMFGHLNNVHFVRYMESGRICHAEQCLKPHLTSKEYNDFVYGQGVGPILKSIAIQYKAITWFPDNLVVCSRVLKESLGRDRFEMDCAIISEAQERIVATSLAVIVCYDHAEHKKTAIPAKWLKGIE
jgi:acyl-CoA thioester hydrolase